MVPKKRPLKYYPKRPLIRQHFPFNRYSIQMIQRIDQYFEPKKYTWVVIHFTPLVNCQLIYKKKKNTSQIFEDDFVLDQTSPFSRFFLISRITSHLNISLLAIQSERNHRRHFTSDDENNIQLCINVIATCIQTNQRFNLTCVHVSIQVLLMLRSYG